MKKIKHMKNLTTLAVAVIVTASCFGETTNSLDKTKAATPPVKKPVVGEWTQEFEAAKELAKEKNLPMFLNFTGSDWCGWCMLMDRQVFSTQDWKKYAKENLVLVTLDFPRGIKLPERIVEQNKALQTKFRVGGYPTYFLVSSDGEKTIGKLGASQDANPKDFIGKVRAYLQTEKIAKLESDNKTKYDELIAEREKIEAELAAWLEKSPDMKNALNKRKEDDFKKRIAAVDAKIDAFLAKVK